MNEDDKDYYAYQPPIKELIYLIRTNETLLQAFKDGLTYYQGVDPGRTTFLHGGYLGVGNAGIEAIKRYRDPALAERAMVEDFLMDYNYSPTEFWQILDCNYSDDPLDWISLEPMPLWWPDWSLRPKEESVVHVVNKDKERIYRTENMTQEEQDKRYNDNMKECVEEIRSQIRNFPK